jgi:hypothetical protein
MSDDMTNRDSSPDGGAPASGKGGSDEYAWSEPGPSADRGEKAREWLAQLQAMMEQLATQAAPVVREVGAKAAELAALAGEKAGPVATRTAAATGQAGQRLAERARGLAAELRRDQAAAQAGAEPEPESATTATPASEDSEAETR